MAKNTSNEWSKIIATDKSIVQECLNNIGNLCLLSFKANKKPSSSSFATKAEKIYKKSELLTTKKLASKYKEWNRSNIEDRAVELVELAVEAWPVNE